MGDKRKTSPARRTQHSRQGGHSKKALRTSTVNCLGKRNEIFVCTVAMKKLLLVILLVTVSVLDQDVHLPLLGHDEDVRSFVKTWSNCPSS